MLPEPGVKPLRTDDAAETGAAMIPPSFGATARIALTARTIPRHNAIRDAGEPRAGLIAERWPGAPARSAHGIGR